MPYDFGELATKGSETTSAVSHSAAPKKYDFGDLTTSATSTAKAPDKVEKQNKPEIPYWQRAIGATAAVADIPLSLPSMIMQTGAEFGSGLLGEVARPFSGESSEEIWKSARDTGQSVGSMLSSPAGKFAQGLGLPKEAYEESLPVKAAGAIGRGAESLAESAHKSTGIPKDEWMAIEDAAMLGFGPKVLEGTGKAAYKGVAGSVKRADNFGKNYWGKEAANKAEATRSAVTSETQKVIESQKKLSSIAGEHLGRVKGLSADASKQVLEAVEATKSPEMAKIFTPRPVEEIGKDVQSAVQRTEKKMIEDRDLDIKKMRGTMQEELMQKEGLQGHRVQQTPQFRTAMEQLARLKKDFSANKTLSGKLEDYQRRLSGAPSFDVLSDEIKAIRSEAFKLEGSGFSTKFQKLADGFEDSLKGFSNEYKNMIARYPEISQPLEVMESKAGKAASRTGGFTGEARNVTDASELPKVIFKNPSNFKDFSAASGLGKPEAEKLALDFYKGEVSGKSSVAARKYIEDNASMMRELPEVKAALEREYVAPMQKFEQQVSQAAEHAKENQAVIKSLVEKRGITKESAEKLVTKYENSLKPIHDARTGAEAMSNTETLIYSLSKDGFINEAKRKELIGMIKKTGDALEDHKRAVAVAKSALKYGALGLGVGLGGAWGSGTLFDYFRGGK